MNGRKKNQPAEQPKIVIKFGEGRDAQVREFEGATYKFCADCAGWLQLSEFYRVSGKAPRYSSYCRFHHISRIPRKEAA